MFFFFNDTATTEIYTLSLHDALPILITGAIFWETRPAIIIRPACRGEPRKTSAPKRAMSKREADIDIISMAQHARPKLMGHNEHLRAQFTALSSSVKTRPSNPPPSLTC